MAKAKTKTKPAGKPAGRKGTGKARPDLRIVCASKEEGDDGKREYISLAAFWLDPDTGYYRGGLDGRVKGIVIVTEDGTRINVKAGREGDYFVNCYKGEAPKARKPRKGDDAEPEGDPPADDFGDDDIPF